MSSIFIIKEKIEKPMEWYSKKIECDSEWQFDDILKSYHLGSVYIKEFEDSVSFEDMSEDEFFAMGTSSWIALADGRELIYGYFDDDNGNAEFVHIKNGKCIREYREYNFEVDTDEGSQPEFDDWTDVAEYVEENLL